MVATSRLAAVRYRKASWPARGAGPHRPAPGQAGEVVRAWPCRDVIAQLNFIPVISGAQNDASEIAEWTGSYERLVEDFQRKKITAAPAGRAADRASPLDQSVSPGSRLPDLSRPQGE